MADERRMTDEDLDAIEAREAAATPGPWVACYVPYDGCDDPVIETSSGTYIAQTVYDTLSFSAEHNVDSDTVFIAAARRDVPALVAEVRRLREELRKS